mmetsp:Transcript_21983/g.50737  ORF Transcript_21983/g.50737 Transcript_21983/m.50737 type:complete len:199 (+) Transcript_21983:71-667(+)
MELKEFIRSLHAFHREKNPPSSLFGLGRSQNIVDLSLIDLDWINQVLFHLIVRPISKHLFQKTESMDTTLDWYHGYVASYYSPSSSSSSSSKSRLNIHTDDSEVTLNLCLCNDFEGGNVRFHGLRGDPESEEEYEPRMGMGLLHSGRHFHEVTNVTKGERFVYILWTRSWSGTRHKTCPCCWLNRRQDESCICDWKWN